MQQHLTPLGVQQVAEQPLLLLLLGRVSASPAQVRLKAAARPASREAAAERGDTTHNMRGAALFGGSQCQTQPQRTTS